MRLAFLAALALSSSILYSQTRERVLTPEVALDLKRVADVQLSPDGRQVVYRIGRPRKVAEPRGGAVGELWRIDVRGGAPSRIDAGFHAHRPRWSPDGSTLAWIAQKDPSSTPQVHLRPEGGGPVAALTASPGPVVAFEWSPDGRRIAYTAEDPATSEEIQALKEGRDGYVYDENYRQIRLYTVDREAKETALVSRAELTVREFAWSPDGAAFALSASATPLDDEHSLRTRPFVVSASGGEPRLLAKTDGPLSSPCWSSDGAWIVWLGSIAITDPSGGSVFVLPADGTGEPRNLTEGFEGTGRWLGPIPGTNRLALLAEVHQGMTVNSIDPVSGRMETLEDGGIFIEGPSFERTGAVFAVSTEAPEHPAEVYLGGPEGPLRRLTHSNSVLEGLTLGAQEVTRWRSSDGLSIEGVLIKPVGFQPGVRYPVVVHVHGGSEAAESNGWFGSYISWGQLLAARGYAVIYPNYRGSTGRGVDFSRANRRDLMGKEWDDIESALDHVIGMGIGDPDRAGIYGFSWGGYAAGWGATWASHRFKAVVAGAGIYNWTSEAGTNDTRTHEQLVHWDLPLYEHASYYLERSPIAHIRKAKTPTLLLHGELDPSCPVGQSIEMHTALKWKGVPVELVIYPREGHGMTERPHQEDFLNRGLAWLDRYLLGR